ncbi:MAG: hypothetical protein RSJ40_05515 [Acetivibrio sp.]
MQSFNKNSILGSAYYKAALIKGTFEYYTLFEQITEKKAFKEELPEVIHRGILVLLGENPCINETIECLDKQRNEMIKKMQVLTAYTDILQIYEYVLNRMEQRYHAEEEIEETAFTDKLFQYVFSVKDNMVINENIKEIIGQLPVRMTRSHYFDLIRESMTLYKGGDRESLSSFLYMIRTSAMLYRPEGMDELFPEYKETVDSLQNADYTELTEEEHKKLEKSLEEMAQDLVEKTDFYVRVQELLNSVYTAILGIPFKNEEDFKEEKICLEILQDIEKEEWQVEDKLVLLEGKQESAFDKIMRLEGGISDKVDKNTDERILKLIKMGKLMSTSIFIELDKEEDTTEAEDTFVREAFETLHRDLNTLFQKNHKMINRAVMANTLNKLPVFFHTTQEVMDYIKNSLGQCSDFSEKNVSMKILSELMEL